MEHPAKHSLATKLYREIGSICASEYGSVDFENGSAAARGYNHIFSVNVRSNPANFKGSMKIWNSLHLQDAKDPLENYQCMVSEDGEVMYAEAEVEGAITDLDLDKPAHRLILSSMFNQLESTRFLPADNPDWSKAELDKLDSI